jgi:lysophospholipase L1-like esterase
MTKTTRRVLAWAVLFGTLFVARETLSQPIGIVALGDSNTAGYGVGRDRAFPAYLERMLRAAGHDVQVWNAGVSGDTFERLLARLDRYVPDGMRIVILQGGYNDLLRRNNSVWIAGYIQAIVSRLRARQIEVVLCGFFYPDWDKVGIAVAEYYGAIFVDGSSCYAREHRIFADLHMNVYGHQAVAARLFPVLQRLLSAKQESATQHDVPNPPPKPVVAGHSSPNRIERQMQGLPKRQ